MRGGVSLAVWIGGAIAELDLVRRGTLNDTSSLKGDLKDRADTYAKLLGALGYSGIRFDVLAGASAGGLNAVIYGFAQSVGVGLERLSDVWQDEGDLWKLFHPQWGSARDENFGTAAVLRGDGAFYRAVFKQLLAWMPKKAPQTSLPTITDYLTVDLSATLQAGPPLPDRISGVDIRPRTAHFRFRKTPARPGAFNDMPARPDDGPADTDDDQRIRRLAYAARSTSSFPGAFEPAGVVSWRRTGRIGRSDRDRRAGRCRNRKVEPDPVTTPDPPRNMVDVFSEVGHEPDTVFDVMDGGVLDNIPIGRAVQAIADAPATGLTQRVLIYLDPSPPRPVIPRSAAKTEPGGRRRPRFLSSALTALRYQATVQTASDDIREIGRLRAAADDIELRRRTFLEGLPASMCAIDGARLSVTYHKYRATTDAARVADLLAAPGVGFLRALVPNPPVRCALGPQEAARVRVDLDKMLAATSTGANIQSDGTALIAAATLLISWVQLEEAAAAGKMRSGLGAAKGALYRARAVGQYVQQRRDKAAVLVALGSPNRHAPRGRVTSDELERITHALRPDRSCWSAVPRPLRTDAELWERLEWAAPSGEHPLATVLAAGWVTLCRSFEAVDPADRNDSPILRTLARSDRSWVFNARRVQLVTMAASVSVGTLSTTAAPKFYTFSGDEPVLEAGHLSKVLAQARADAADDKFAGRRRASDADTDVPSPASPVTAQSKLAGNQLANFASFLSRSWRRHDFEWGRADAGAALIRVLRDLDPQTDPKKDPHKDPKVLDEVLGRARNKIQSMYATLDRRKFGIADLPAPRLFALVTRLVLGIQRGLWPSLGRRHEDDEPSPGHPAARPTPRWVRWLGAIALLVLRPLLVLIPLISRPWVLLGVAGTVAGANHLRHPPAGDLPAELSGVLFTAAAVLGISLATLTIWKRVAKRWESIQPGPTEDSRSEHSDAGRSNARPPRMPRTVTWIFVGAQVMAALAVLIGTTAVVAPQWLLSGRTLLAQATGFDGIVLIAVAAAVFFYARGFTGSRLLALSLDPAEPDVVGRWVTAGGTALWATGWMLGSNDQPLLLVGSATALVVAILLWAVHDAWADIGWQWLIVIAGGTLTALLLVTFVPRQIPLPGVLAPARGLLLAGAAVLLLMIVLAGGHLHGVQVCLPRESTDRDRDHARTRHRVGDLRKLVGPGPRGVAGRWPGSAEPAVRGRGRRRHNGGCPVPRGTPRTR